MKAYLLVGPSLIKQINIKKPSIGSNDVLIKSKVVGICGSDLHQYNLSWMNSVHTKVVKYVSKTLFSIPFISEKMISYFYLNDNYIMKQKKKSFILNKIMSFFPFLIMGHEFSGEIVEIGNDVKGIKVGQRVAITPHLPCYSCEACNNGLSNLCNRDREIGSGSVHGALQEYIKINSMNVFSIPDDVSLGEAALLDAVAPALHAVNLAEIQKNHKVIILGAGTIGIILLQLLKLSGIENIVITDKSDYNLKLASNFGAKNAVNICKLKIGVVKEKLGLFDRVFECVGGRSSTLKDAINLVNYHGRIITIGNFDLPQNIDVIEFRKKEPSLIGCSRYTKSELIKTMDLIVNKEIKLKPLITHKFSTILVNKAFHVANDKKKYNSIKVQIVFV